MIGERQTNIFLEERDFCPVRLNGTERAFFLEWKDGQKKNAETKARTIRTRSSFSSGSEFFASESSVEFADSWKVVVFDTETTGLPKDWKAPVSDVENWPRLVELAFTTARLSLETFEILEEKSSEMIIEPDGFEIPEGASKVHGVTTEKAIVEGIPIATAAERIAEALRDADFLVAHNMRFDEKILGAELLRLKERAPRLDKVPKICTMLQAQKIFKKWVKLQDLYKYFFEEEFSGAHRAGADTEAALHCFVELLKNKTIDLKKEAEKWL